jgi:hypothetical protein
MTPYNYTGGGTQNGRKSGEEETGEEWALFKIKDKSSGVALHGNSHRLVLQNMWRIETRSCV